MIYAHTHYGEVRRKVKPRLRRRSGFWECGIGILDAWRAPTAQEAYQGWIKHGIKENRDGKEQQTP